MTTGVRVFGTDTGKIVEIEYFYGIDVADLDHIPEFTTVQAFWPRYKGGTWVEYVVDAHCKRNSPGEVRLVVTYNKSDQPPEFREQHDAWGTLWGTNTIILQKGEQKGRCEWLPEDEDVVDWKTVKWEAFDLGAARARPHATYRGSRREAGFRKMILARDDRRCVLTSEATTKALDAAHLIPAANGENDVPSNGITLRADLHRLFDAGLFTFAKDGRAVDIAPGLSEYYRQLLENCDPLPQPTRERVQVTLASRPFLRRGDPAGC